MASIDEKPDRHVQLRDNLLKVACMFIRGLPYRLLFGKNRGHVMIGRMVRIRNPGSIRSSGRIIIEDFAELQGLSVDGLVFGKNVTIGSQAIIRCSGYYSREIGAGLKVGDSSNIGIQSYLGCGGGIDIGNNVMMGPKVSIHSENHNFAETEKSMKSQGVRRSATIIEDDVWVGSGSRIMSGVRVGAGSVVAAGAVVTKDVPRNVVVGGVPAKVLKRR